MKILHIIFLLFIMTSCAVIQESKMANQHFVYLKKTDFEKLNGEYRNYADTAVGVFIDNPNLGAFHPLTFWEQIKRHHRYSQEEINQQTVRVTFVSNRKAVLELIKSDSIVDSKVISVCP
ncbi:MAG: hypothetical protein Q7J34_05595 [Bacteroidales bacterium]|nr:hypothetical protein [Bacteroidales bacterium]